MLKGGLNLKGLTILMIAILILSGFGTAAMFNSNSSRIEETILVSQPDIITERDYNIVTLNESTSFLQNPGKPILPIITKVYTLPFGSKIDSIDVIFSEKKEIILDKDIKPAPLPQFISKFTKTYNPNEIRKYEPVYSSSNFYPTTSYSYTIGSGLKDNEHIIYIAVHCYPIRYSPAYKTLYFSDNFKIKITYKLHQINFSDTYDLIIITPSKFSDALQPLVDHKNNMGVKTILKTTEDIYQEYNGRDKPEQIKYFIKDAIEQWGVKYVLLVGDIQNIPIRKTWMYHRWHNHYWNETILSDLYYADIYDSNGSFSSWDSNDNGLYGENYWNCPGVNDTADLYADVNIGRLACSNEREVHTVVDKIIHYETETYGENWFNKIILCGGDTFPNWDGNEGEKKNMVTEQIMSNFTPITLWTSDNTFTPDNINKAVNNGAGFIDYSGHGFEYGLGTHPPDSQDWIYYYTPYLLGLRNGYKLPIIFFDACLTAKLDFTISDVIKYFLSADASKIFYLISDTLGLNISRRLPCFAWYWVKERNGGAIATIGATRTAYGSMDMGCGYLSLRFYKAYSSSDMVSQMLTKAQNDYINNLWRDYFTLEEFILLGDPTLMIGGYPK